MQFQQVYAILREFLGYLEGSMYRQLLGKFKQIEYSYAILSKFGHFSD